ncbi:MAG: hypothetical protein KDD45_00465 [Bdellovibrionales bacterium]|nr:hypothetical protein [Bdellovibrionales bacterium]
MSTVVNLIISIMFLMGTGYAVKEFFFNVEKTAVQRIDKGLSKSEPFAQKLTGIKLGF